MHQPSQATCPTDLILEPSAQKLGQVHWRQVDLNEHLQPGSMLEFEGKTYQVLERRHQYQLKANRYQLHRRILHIQRVQNSADKHLLGNQWVIGDPTCRFNARSENFRCAVNPEGPCEDCKAYEVLPK